MRQFSAYAKVLAMSAREDNANQQRLVISILQLIFRLVMIVAIYKVVYATSPQPGMQIANAMWSVGIYFAFVLGLDLRSVARLIDVEVKHGTLETGMVKPLNWRLVKVCEHLGKRGIEFLIQLVLLPLILFALVGLPEVGHLTPWLVAGEILMVLLAIVSVSSLFLMVGLSAIWLNDAMPMFRIVDKLAAVLCGAFVPFALLPSVVQEVVRWSPFGIYAAPQQMFNPAMSSIVVPTIISGIVWTFVILLCSQWMWTRVQKRIEVNGG